MNDVRTENIEHANNEEFVHPITPIIFGLDVNYGPNRKPHNQ